MEQFTPFLDLINYFANEFDYEQSNWYKITKTLINK